MTVANPMSPGLIEGDKWLRLRNGGWVDAGDVVPLFPKTIEGRRAMSRFNDIVAAGDYAADADGRLFKRVTSAND